MAMQYIENAHDKELSSMNVEGINAFLKELVASKHETAPITCGFFRMEVGNPLEYTYNYDECKIMLSGEITITEKGGKTVTMMPGDVIFFEKGTTVTFSSARFDAVFYVAQRKLGEL